MTLDPSPLAHHEDAPAPEHTPHHDHSAHVHAPAPTKKGTRLVQGLAILALFVALAAALTAAVYLRSPEDAFVQKVAGIIPYPAAFVSTRPISLRDYFVERAAVEKYIASANPGAALPENLGSQILETLINKQAINNLAKKHGLEATQEEIDARYTDAIGDLEESAFVAQLNDVLGWTPEEFKQRILRSEVLAKDVSAWVSSDKDTQAEPRSRMDAAYARLQASEDFAVVAGTASEDTTATSGGDLGFLAVSDLPEAWRDQVTALEVGTYSPIIETDTAFVIFKATDRVVGEAETPQIRLSAIVVQKKTLDDAVTDYLKTVTVRKLIRL